MISTHHEAGSLARRASAIDTQARDAPVSPRDGRIRTYLWWAWWAVVTFSAVYPTTNWLTSLRSALFHLYLPAELAIPLVPQFIWIYLSMYALFVLPAFVLPAARMHALGKQLVAGTLASGLLFLLFPAELGFARVAPPEVPYATIYSAMFSIDHPYNLVPSLHMVFSSAIALACADVATPLIRATLLGWLALIAVSTILVHQHHVLDLVAAIVLVSLLRHRYTVTHV